MHNSTLLTKSVLVAALVMLAGPGASPSKAQTKSSSSPCTDGSHPEYRQADAWIGVWDVFNGTKKTATVSIQPSVNGCALAEIWTTEAGDSHGLIAYSPSTHKWDYLYVTPRGVVIRLADGEMVGNDFKFVQAVPVDGKVHHWSLSKLPSGGFRELSVASSDGGKTWSTDYDFNWSKKK